MDYDKLLQDGKKKFNEDKKKDMESPYFKSYVCTELSAIIMLLEQGITKVCIDGDLSEIMDSLLWLVDLNRKFGKLDLP